MADIGGYSVGQARDLMYQTFWASWMNVDTGWPSVFPDLYALPDNPDGTINPAKPQVIWDGQEPDDDVEVTSIEAYVCVRHTNGEQASLRGADGGIRWRRTGFFSCRLRFPGTLTLITTDALVKVVSDTFRGKRAISPGGGIWFRKVREVESGIFQERNRQDVLAYFEYDEIS